MSTGGFEQRNPYQGSPPRPWAKVRLQAPDGTMQELDLQVDTGSPFALILTTAAIARLGYVSVSPVSTNFGQMGGGWLQLAMPELGLVQLVIGYASDTVVNAAQSSSPNFAGLLGMPVLRLVEYGGDADWFWLRGLPQQP